MTALSPTAAPSDTSLPPRLDTQADLDRHLQALAALDPAVAAGLARLGHPEIRRRDGGFHALLNTIISQQVSTHAATAIRNRLLAAIDPLTPETLLAAGDEMLKAAGLSLQKRSYALDLARRTAEGSLDFAGLERLEDEAVIEHLTAVKGIGRWTAEIYLLFAMGRPDVWPADDLALAVAAGHIRGLPERPKGRECRALAEAWAPHRGAAALFCWHYYHDLTRRDAVSVLADRPAAKPTAKPKSPKPKTKPKGKQA